VAGALSKAARSHGGWVPFLREIQAAFAGQKCRRRNSIMSFDFAARMTGLADRVVSEGRAQPLMSGLESMFKRNQAAHRRHAAVPTAE